MPLTFWLVYRSLDSSGGWFVLGFYSLVPILAAAGEFRPGARRACTGTALFLMIILGTLLVGEILLLPYRAYELWFDLFRLSLERGRVSHLFVKLATLLSVIICWIIYRHDRPLDALKQLIYLPLFFLFILWPSAKTAMIFLCAFLLGRLRHDNYRGLISLLFIVIFIGLTGLKSPARGARFIDNRTENLITWLTSTWPSLPILYDIPLYGESFSHTTETGGRPILTGHNIFSVEGSPGEQIYLRTGTGPSPGRRGGSLSVSELFPADRENAEGLKTYPVRIQADFINLIPYTEKTEYLMLKGRFYPVENRGLTLLPDPPLITGDAYTLFEEEERRPALEAEDFDFSAYLGREGEGSEKLAALALSLRGENPRVTAENIRQYLARNYEYSLDTKESLDYTEDFLFTTKKGYCLHFATAFAALARENGIPCRFAEGYLVIFPDGETYWENYGYSPERVTVNVTGLSSHVWPELYLPESGWTSFEATAPFYRPESRTAGDSLTLRQLRDIRSEDELDEREDGTETIPPLLYLAVPLLFLLVRGTGKIREVLTRFGKNTLFVIRRYVRIAYSAGVDRPRKTGWIEWGKKITREVPRSEELVSEIFPLILKARYSPDPLTEEEMEELHSLLHDFKRICRENR